VTASVETGVGQQTVVNIRMVPAALAETVTVTGGAALVDITQSKLGGNIDTRQMQEIPVNGRNWVNLTLLAPGRQAADRTDRRSIRRSSASIRGRSFNSTSTASR
jgi:hypothetical protein